MTWRSIARRLRVEWVQRVHGRSGRFDNFNDPVLLPICSVCHERIESGRMFCEEHEPGT